MNTKDFLVIMGFFVLIGGIFSMTIWADSKNCQLSEENKPKMQEMIVDCIAKGGNAKECLTVAEKVYCR